MRFVLFLDSGLDRADHGELSVAKVVDIVLDVHGHRADHGVAPELYPQQRQVVAQVAAGFVVARHAEDLFDDEDLVAFVREQVVVDEACVFSFKWLFFEGDQCIALRSSTEKSVHLLIVLPFHVSFDELSHPYRSQKQILFYGVLFG